MDVRFIADDHLGKLARYLRIIGCDCLYYHVISDDVLMEISKKENRVVLSRDWKLYRYIPSQRYFFIRSQNTVLQLKEVCGHFRIDPFLKMFERCIICNALLVPIEKEDVRPRVPPKSYAWKKEFKECRRCKRVYWPGTHYEAMISRIRDIFSA
jgi:uncharacterized protein with PIN domain